MMHIIHHKIKMVSTYTNIGRKAFGTVARKVRDDLEVMQLGLERGQLLLAGGRQVRVELQEVREQLPQLLPLHRLSQGGRHEPVKASLFSVRGTREGN